MMEINELTDSINALEHKILGMIPNENEMLELAGYLVISKQECILGYDNIIDGLSAYHNALIDFDSDYKN